MATRKSMTLPVIITLILIGIIVYLFANIKQTEVTCVKNNLFDDNIRVNEEVTAVIDNKKIDELIIQKEIILPEKYLKDDTYLNSIKYSLEETLEYLGDKASVTVGDDRVTVKINVKKNEVVLLNNISFNVNDDLQIEVDSNTKSSNVVTLSVGDNYTDGEFMKRLKNNGYTCK